MDYKEKYNKLVEAIKVLQETNPSDEGIQKWVNDNVPELKESEDERIRKELMDIINLSYDCGIAITKENRDKYIAWFEKQCEQKPKKVSIWKHWKDGIAGNGEGKQIYLIKAGNTYNLSSCLCFECDYIELSELDKLMREEKQGKTMWTEEDEKNLCGIIDEIQANKSTAPNYDIETYDMFLSWLKQLKQRMI